MSINVNDGFKLSSSDVALDSRCLYKTLVDMASATEGIYDGCICYCEETSTHYTFNKSNALDETTGYWREFESATSWDDISNKPEFDDVSLDEFLEQLDAEEPEPVDLTTVRYNMLTGYLQVKINGFWIDAMDLNIPEQPNYLYYQGVNVGEFTTYEKETGFTNTPAMISAEFLNELVLTYSHSGDEGSYAAGVALSKPIDLTDYTTLTVKHESTSTSIEDYNWVVVFLTDNIENDVLERYSATDHAKAVLHRQEATNEPITIDIGTITGTFYIGIEVCASNGSTVKTIISEISLS